MNSRACGPAPSGSVLSRTKIWIGFFAALGILGLGCAALYAESARSFFKRGQSAEAREDYDAAYENYQKAFSMSPKD